MWVNSGSVEPLIFISISIPINMFKLFNIDNIYNLVETSYSQDFIKKKKKLIWYFNYNIMICFSKIYIYINYDIDLSNMDEVFYKQFIYFIFTHTYIIWIF